MSLALAAAVLLLAGRADARRDIIEKLDPAGEPKTEQQFLARAIAADIAEIKFSEGAAKHAESKEVRAFARQMVNDHTKNREKLLRVARTLKLAVVEGLGKGRRAEMLRLMELKGNAYDREYIRTMVQDHEKALKMYETWTSTARKGDLRDTASRAVPVIKEHLRRAKELQSKLKA
jgi:putative membrane protein